MAFMPVELVVYLTTLWWPMTRRKRKDDDTAHFFRDNDLAVNATDKNDLPLVGHMKRNGLGELSVNEIRIRARNHSFSREEMEYLLELLAMRISVYLNNKFVCY